mmetsp:Transcript_20568/g.57340  ORF Transcript_20568/g.57340 Transcript_20568/m.57340 type:complete len:100 (+) Transcript_20568:135-434(+)
MEQHIYLHKQKLLTTEKRKDDASFSSHPRSQTNNRSLPNDNPSAILVPAAPSAPPRHGTLFARTLTLLLIPFTIFIFTFLFSSLLFHITPLPGTPNPLD